MSGNSIVFGEEIRILGFFNAHDIWSTDASDLSQHNKTIKWKGYLIKKVKCQIQRTLNIVESGAFAHYEPML